MTSDHHGLPCLHRVADQLRVLSEVTEALTYRLLELEEKFAATEEAVRHFLEEQHPGVDEELETRLCFTEAKLARIESLLRMVERSGTNLHLVPVTHPPLQQDCLPVMEQPDSEEEAECFLDDEGEQPFMDELIA